jgi:hypothetical protein
MTQTSLQYLGGIDYDPNTARFFATDIGNNRVMLFYVLGHPK